MTTALVLNAGGTALLGSAAAGLTAWQRHRRRRGEALRRRYEETYDLLVAMYGRGRGERVMRRSIERFERDVQVMTLSGVGTPTVASR